MRSSPRATRGGENGATRILGVDPGTVITGWGVVDVREGSRVAYVDSGVIRLRGERAARLSRLHRLFGELCNRLGPQAVVIEQSFVGDNVQTAFRLGEARGALMVAAQQSGVATCEYAPATIKSSVTGSGRAIKEQVQTMVQRLLGLQKALIADEADALAAAICHAHHCTWTSVLPASGRRSGRSWRSYRPELP